MMHLVLLGILTLLLFITFLVVLIVGLVSNSRVKILTAACILLVTLGMGGYVVYQFTSKTITKIADAFKPRTGLEIYTAEFGRPIDSCMTIANSNERFVRGMTHAIWLEFQTCPKELERIINRHPFKMGTFVSSDTLSYYPTYDPKPGWWTPQLLGDTVLVARDFSFNYPARDRVLVFAKDSSYAFYCDMTE